jgi:RES domain-containing protein
MTEAQLLNGEADPEVKRVRWAGAIRIIPSRYPPVDLYERVAPPEDYSALHELESLTNARLREERGKTHLVRPGDEVKGPGASYIMAPFAHLAPGGARFNDETFGALYAGRDRATSIAETCHHREKFMAATNEPPMTLDMRVLEMRLDARVHDVRGLRAELPRVYALDDYGASQQLARRLHAAHSWAIVYDSVRRDGGECVAVWRPRAVSHCRQAEHLQYEWDGRAISGVYRRVQVGR